ncbi:hypothetical protein [Actinomadura rubrisoli]|nr:hypothetical protein [Actinomadura rubrisoli]
MLHSENGVLGWQEGRFLLETVAPGFGFEEVAALTERDVALPSG